MEVEFYSLASGSKGNCTYIATENTKILIDVGLSCRETEKKLKEIEVNIEEIDGIFITHEHIDHIKGVGVLSRKYKIPIYSLEETREEILKKKNQGKIEERLLRCIYVDEKNVINDICIEAFEVPHDAVKTVGYEIKVNDIKICIATDLGHITKDVKNRLTGCDILLIESNYDEYMLQTGKYPRALKERIKSNLGHLSNIEAGRLIVDIVDTKLKYLFLGHISDENNRPSKAEATIFEILDSEGIKYNIKKSFRIDVASSMKEKIVIKKAYE